MTRGYSLRRNTKGRQRHQSTHETDDQVNGTGMRPASPDTPRAAHKSPAPTQDSKRQSMEEDWQRRSRSIVTPSTIISTTTTLTRYRVERRPETLEEIQAARKREEARRFAEAVRIRREQIVRGYEEELRALRARIMELRRECEVEVAKVRKKSERSWAVERGEVSVVVEDGEEGLLVGEDEDEEDLLSQSQWQQQPQHMGTFPPSSGIVGPSPSRRLELEATTEEDDEMGPGETHTGNRRLTRNHPESQGRRKSHSRRQPRPPSRPQPQPLRRRPAQLMAIPTTSSSHGLNTYGTAGVLNPDPETRFGGTDGDNDSEMDG